MFKRWMNFTNEKPLAWRAIVPFMAISFFTILTTSVLQIFIESNRSYQSVRDDVLFFQQQIQSAAADSIVTQNKSKLDLLVTKGLSHPAIKSMAFFDKDGQPLTLKTDSAAKGDEIETYDLIFPGKGIVGRLAVEISLTPARESIKHFVYTTLIGNGFLLLVNLALVAFFANLMIRPFLSIRSQLLQMSQSTGSGAEHLISASRNLDTVTNQQSVAAKDSMTSLSEVKQMIDQTLQNVSSAADLGKKISLKTNQGSETMMQMAQSMSDIEASNQQLAKLSEIIQQVANKMTVINQIVFKTQLLSFNASIEAARAGQHGKGFSVVADEVGKLAQMSGAAAKEIQSLIKDNNKQVNRVISDVTATVTQGKRNGENALLSFNEIARDVEKISNSIEEVAKASGQQAKGIENTSDAMSQMKNAVEACIKANEDIANMADISRKNSQLVNDVTKHLRILIGGKIREKASPKSDRPKAAEVVSIDKKKTKISKGA